MGNISTTPKKPFLCYNDNRKYICKNCDISLCARCKEKHIKGFNTRTHIVICKKCDDEEREYFCKTCKCDLCVNCKEFHVKCLETECHDVIRERVICTHFRNAYLSLSENLYVCTACKDILCVQCKQRHDEDKDTKFHGILRKIIACYHTNQKYFCETCQRKLCVPCKEKHVVDLDTKSHEVEIEQKPYQKETCEVHPDVICEMWCLSYKRPVCFRCLEQGNHQKMELEYAYKSFRKYHKDRVRRIRSEIIPYNRFLLTKICSEAKTEIETQNTKISTFQINLTNKAWRLKHQIDMACTAKLSDVKYNLILKLQHRQREMMRQLSIIETYENKNEQSANRPVQFLLLQKKTVVPRIKNVSDTFTFSLNEATYMTDVIELLEIHITEKRKRQVENEEMLELMSIPLLQTIIDVPRVYRVRHISHVTSDRLWISDGEDLVFTDNAGKVLYNLRDISSYGGHSVLSESDLVYVDSDYNIQKLSKKYITSIFIKKSGLWRPQCIHSSLSTGDFLVGMRKYDKNKHRYTAAKVVRYNNSGKQVHTIQENNKGQNLFSEPNFITENRNGDVIVSDWLYAVVVTDREGRHRFSYTGPTPESRLEPCGICTDVLSNILVCDLHTHTVQIIDKDGNFLSLLVTENHGIREPWSLTYNNENHLLSVGSRDTPVICVYRHIRRRILQT